MSKAKYLVFDTETSSTNPLTGRIVQLFIATADESGNLIDTWEWVMNPGVPIPEEASNIHGYTTERLEEIGEDPEKCLAEARDVFLTHKSLVWVAYNLEFDMSYLNAEFKRHGLSEMFGAWATVHAKLADALLIDRHKDRYRKGGRKLMNLADHYGVEYDEENLHDASEDVRVTAQVTAKVIGKFGLPSTKEQVVWYRKWADGFEEFKKRSDPNFVMDNKVWPLREED